MRLRSASREHVRDCAPARPLLSFLLALAVGLAPLAATVGLSRAQSDDAGVRSFLLTEAARMNSGRRAASPALATSPGVVTPARGRGLVARYTAGQRVRHAKTKRGPAFATAAQRKSSGYQLAVTRPDRAIAPSPASEPIAGGLARGPEASVGLAHRPWTAPHLVDRTLRRGDIVVTLQGVRIFKGAERFPFQETDFASLRQIPRTLNHVALQAIDLRIKRERFLLADARTPGEPRWARPGIERPTRLPVADVPTPQRALAYAPAPGATTPTPASRAISHVLKIDRDPSSLRASDKSRALHGRKKTRPSFAWRPRVAGVGPGPAVFSAVDTPAGPRAANRRFVPLF
jgi:hypothetical protein